jgi:hypothetical protein
MLGDGVQAGIGDPDFAIAIDGQTVHESRELSFAPG